MAATPDKQMIVGLDIGTSKIVALVAEVDDDGNIELIAPVSYTHLTLPTICSV